ncbi:MAG: thiamine-binding protein [Actinomycetota bacterium]
MSGTGHASVDPSTRSESTESTDEARLEVFVEPFAEARPGPHVTAAVAAIEAAGLEVDLGALATTADGPLDDLVDAAGATLRAAFANGATAIQLRIERTG